MSRPERPRPRPVVLNAIPDGPLPGDRKRPDPALPLVAAAFAMGVVLAATGALALRWTGGDTVPARTHQQTVTQLAAERAARGAADQQVAAQADALAHADELARRLVAALDNPAGVTSADLTALRTEVARQSRTIERVRVVRVPVPTAPVAGARTPARPEPVRRSAPPEPTAMPAPTPACALQLLGTCIAR